MYEFDKTDIKIVNLLLEDGRMSASEISRRMGDISERAVRYRIERMREDNILQIGVVVRPEAFGLLIKADVWLEVELDRILEVAKKMAEFENVSYVACGIGEKDVSIQIVAKDTAEIYHFVTEVVRKVPGVRRQPHPSCRLFSRMCINGGFRKVFIKIPKRIGKSIMEVICLVLKASALQKRAQEIMPLGCKFQFSLLGRGHHTLCRKGEGCISVGCGWKANILIIAWHLARSFLGHSYDEVDQKVIEEIQKGILFAMTGELEVAVAEMIVEMCPAVEMVRLACSGTEATMHAIRVARAYTGRDIDPEI